MSKHVGDFGKLVREEMEANGLFELGWDYNYDRARKRLGCCWHREKLLTFSLPYIECNTIANMHDTILHEIAHALVGPGQGHGLIWKNKARRLGAVPRACATDPNIVSPYGDYMGQCKCKVHFFHRKSVLGRILTCRKCGGKAVIVKTPANFEMPVFNPVGEKVSTIVKPNLLSMMRDLS